MPKGDPVSEFIKEQKRQGVEIYKVKTKPAIPEELELKLGLVTLVMQMKQSIETLKITILVIALYAIIAGCSLLLVQFGIEHDFINTHNVWAANMLLNTIILYIYRESPDIVGAMAIGTAAQLIVCHGYIIQN